MPDYTADFYSFLFQISMVYLVPQRAAIRAATECVVLKLKRSDLNRILPHFPKGRS